MKSSTLYYIHDPMCSWCWGFSQTWGLLAQSLPNEVEIRYVLGGLAPDNNQPMDTRTRAYIQHQWRMIQQQIPGVQFNFDFWEACQPKRSTYIACRAVIAAKNQHPKYEVPMIRAIQQAYYLQAQNPSEKTTLIQLAKALNLDVEQFSQDLVGEATQQQLNQDIMLAKSLGVRSFPSLVLSCDNQNTLLKIDYNKPDIILAQILA